MKLLWNLLALAAILTGSAEAATYYIDYSAGSDANSGISKTSAWKRAPGMKGFTGSYRHVAGDRFIFRGGVTWPVDCFQMKITAGGSSDTVRDYYGADPAWFAGSAFSRPLFDFQHTLVGPGWTAAAGVLVEGCNYITFDNLELARHRTPLQIDGLINWGSAAICLSACSGFTLSDCVVRDWDMPVPIALGSSGGGGIIRVNSGGNNVVTSCTFHQQGVPVRTGTAAWNIDVIAYTDIHHTATAIMSAHLVHHCHIHHLEDPTDLNAHSNVMLCNGGLRAYNNLIHDISPAAQVVFVAPGYYGAPAQDWIYNNVIYNVAQPCIAIDTDGMNHPGSGTHVMNNTLVGAYGTGHCIRVGYRANGDLPLLEARNNHYITASAAVLKDNPSRGGGHVTTFLDGPNLAQTPAQATAAGYVLSNAYQPVDSAKPTVNKGTSLAAVFAADIRDAVRGQLGAWDIGAYEFGGTSTTGNPGILVQDAAARSVSETAASISVVVNRTGGTAGAISCSYSTANGSAIAGVNYVAASGTLSWASGDATSKTITVAIRNTAMLGNKDFAINLSAPAGGASLGSPASTVVTIAGSAAIPEPDGVLANPGFESGLAGWTASGNVVFATLPYRSSEGARMAVFNGGQSTPNGLLAQNVTTMAGRTYTLSFDAGAFAFNSDEQRLQVTVRGSGTLLSRTVSVFGAGGGSSRWVPQTFSFVADGPVALLRFQDVSPKTLNLDLMLDNIRIIGSTPPPVQTPPPTIGTQPASLTVAAGSPAAFSVVASGAAPLSYQWQFNGAAIPGAVGANYSINSAQAAHAGTYTVVVSNSGGSVASSAATLALVVPAPASFVNGSFESDFTGWTRSGNLGIGFTPSHKPTQGTKLTVFNSGQSAPNGVLSQSFGTVPGQTYSLAFDAGVLAYNFNEQRLQVTVRGQGVLLARTVSVFGKGGGSTTWAAQSFTFVADSADTTVTFADVSPTTLNLDMVLDNVRVSAATGTTPPGQPLAIVTQPASLRIAAGSSAAFSVVASGTGVLTYQWRFNGNDIPGATGSSYTVNSAQAVHEGSYSVVVSNGSTSVTSAAAVLAVEAPLPVNGFTNGGFELDYAGWTSSGNQILLPSLYFPGADDGYLISFNSGDKPANGVLSQTFATTPGQRYTMSFMVGVLSYNTSEQRLQVHVQGAGPLQSNVVSIFGASGGSVRWKPQSFTFVANSASTTVTFRDVSPATVALDVLLDTVSVQTN